MAIEGAYAGDAGAEGAEGDAVMICSDDGVRCSTMHRVSFGKGTLRGAFRSVPATRKKSGGSRVRRKRPQPFITHPNRQ